MLRPWLDRPSVLAGPGWPHPHRKIKFPISEFERLMPLIKTGGLIPSVDHQTPPGVSLEQYRIYRRLLDEYALA